MKKIRLFLWFWLWKKPSPLFQRMIQIQRSAWYIFGDWLYGAGPGNIPPN